MRNKIGGLLLSLAIAFGLWVYVVTNVSPEHEQTFTGVPVVLENTNSLLDKDLMLLSGDTYTVSFTLQGNRSDLNKLNPSNLKVTMDLSVIQEAGKHQCEYRIGYPSGVSSVSLKEKITEKVAVEVTEYAEKKVPVKLLLKGDLAEDVFVDEEGATTSVTEVLVSGPKFEVDEIDVAGIEIAAGMLTETLVGDYVYTLMDQDYQPVSVDHIQTDTAEIHVDLPVAYKKKIKLAIKIIPGGGATVENTSYGFKNLVDRTITIAGSREALDKIQELVVATVDLANVETTETLEATVPLIIPENLRNLSGLTEVTYVVSLKNLETRSFSLLGESVKIINIPEGMRAVVSTVKVDIVIRGSKPYINSVTEDKIQLTLDVGGRGAGMYSAPVTADIVGVDETHVAVTRGCSVTFELIPIPDDETTPPQE